MRWDGDSKSIERVSVPTSLDTHHRAFDQFNLYVAFNAIIMIGALIY